MIVSTRVREHMKDLLQITFANNLGRLPTTKEENDFFRRNRGNLEDIIKALDSITVNLAMKSVEEVQKREKNSRH